MFRSLDILVVFSAVGIGLITAGLGIVLAKSRTAVLSLFASITLLVLAGSFLISGPATLAEATLLLGLGLAVSLYQNRNHLLFVTFRRLLMRPLVAGLILAVTGVGLVAAGSWRYDQIETSDYEDRVAHMTSQAAWHPPFDSTFEGKTDLGNPLRLGIATARSAEIVTKDEDDVLQGFEWNKRIIKRGLASDSTNCHGWVFTGGKYWVFGVDVPTILEENGYHETTDPQPDDLIVYYKADGTDSVEHTGIVRAVGAVTIVESKWGWMGVYLHAADASCYGTRFKYFRASRPGHQLITFQPDIAESMSRPIDR